MMIPRMWIMRREQRKHFELCVETNIAKLGVEEDSGRFGCNDCFYTCEHMPNATGEADLTCNLLGLLINS